MLRSVGSKGVSHDLATEHQPGSSLHYGSRRLPLACVLLLSLLSRLPGFSAIFMPLTFGSNSLLSPFWVQNPDLDSSLSSESSSSRTGSSSFHPLLLPAAPRDDSARPSPRGPTPTSALELCSAPLLLAQGDLGNPDSNRPSQVTRKPTRVAQRLPGSFWMGASGEGAG